MSDDAGSGAEALVRRFVERSWSAGDEMASAALLGPGFTHHDLVTHAETDATGYLSSILGLRSAFSSIELEIQDAISAGGRVAYRWIAVGDYRSTGATVRVDGISIDHVENGRIVENWTAWDLRGLERQAPGLLDANGAT